MPIYIKIDNYHVIDIHNFSSMIYIYANKKKICDDIYLVVSVRLCERSGL